LLESLDEEQTMNGGKVPLPGSERHPVGTRVGPAQQNAVIEVSIILKPKEVVVIPPPGGPFLTREEFAARYSADAAAIERVKEFAAANGLTVAEVLPVRRTVKLSGTVEQMAKAFSVQLEHYTHNRHTFRARTGTIALPADLADSIEAVLGLDNRPQAKAHFRVLGHDSRAQAANISYTPVQVAQIYQFPAGVDGTGQAIGIIELGGGYSTTDLKNYFASINVKQPKVTAVLVDGATNSPTNANSADGEVLLDIEVAGALAPGASIVVYFAPNTDQGFQDALTTAIHDATNKPSVISISWGGPESTWTAAAMTAFDSAAQDAAALGVTICAASGDDGSSDGVTDGKNHVDFPASSPHILACGGTSLQTSSGSQPVETVWNDGAQGGATGGGYSVQFPLPSWQASAKVKPPSGGGRGVPDVAGDADPATGYQVLVDGQSLVIGGTSAVAPLWSGLIALLNQKLGKPLGLLQPAIYGLPPSDGAFHDITSGSNGAFSATTGWDAATGLGTPEGMNLAKALGGSGSSVQSASGRSST
jgi:kumamolisin